MEFAGPGCDGKSTSLSIPLHGNNINDCLSKYFEEEELSDPVECSNCRSRTQSKKRLLIETRMILIISLKRFDNEGIKNNTNISFPLALMRQELLKNHAKQHVAPLNFIAGSLWRLADVIEKPLLHASFFLHLCTRRSDAIYLLPRALYLASLCGASALKF